MQTDRLLTMKEVKQSLNVCRQTLINWDHAGTLKACRTVGGHRRYRESDIKRLMKHEGENDTRTTKRDD